jgi:predicted RNase H-like HicB family nuclease
MMLYRLAVEDIEPNHWVAWVLDLPGCFSSAQTEAEAVAQAPERILTYYAWLSSHDPSLPVVKGLPAVTVVDRFRAYTSPADPDYLVNAFFEDDRRPLTYWEVAGAQRLLSWTRQDLLKMMRSIPLNLLAGSVGDLLKHMAGAENWYFKQLGLELEPRQLPADPLAMFETVRANTRAKLPQLIGSQKVTESSGEQWSARKVLRRTLWHEQDHTLQIGQLLAQK